MNFSWDWLTWQTAIDAVQIAILYLAIYAILKAGRGSRFGQVLTGAGILFGVSIAFTYLFRFDVLARILQMLLLYLALSSVDIPTGDPPHPRRHRLADIFRRQRHVRQEKSNARNDGQRNLRSRSGKNRRAHRV
jgi:DNA integrity scanning protein DisA with diadenylate cyclase activity